jgi:hypothetical protein
MKRKLPLLIIACVSASLLKAQSYDMRNFAETTSIGIEKSPFGDKKNVVGSQFLFPDWVNGAVINSDGVKFTDGQFNFDKITQNLYVKMKDTSANVAFQVDQSQIKSFSITDGALTFNYTKVHSLDTNKLYNELYKGNKYSLYKDIKTKFIPSDYQTNGIVSSGNMYDEYKDESTYYVVTSAGSSHEISLKSKSIKAFFAPDKDKVDAFFKNHANMPVDENFLVLLVGSLNQ